MDHKAVAGVDESHARSLFLSGRFRDLELYLFERLDRDRDGLVTWSEARHCRLFQLSPADWQQREGEDGGPAAIFLNADFDSDGSLQASRVSPCILLDLMGCFVFAFHLIDLS